MEPPSAIEQAIRSIIPAASPTELMGVVVEHAATANHNGTGRKRRARRRHGAYVRLRELEQSKQYNLQLDVIDLQRQLAELSQLRELLAARALNRADDGDGTCVRIASVYYDVMQYGYREIVVLDDATRQIETAAYLESVMADDVAIGRFTGRNIFQSMMKRYTKYFSGNQMRLTNAMALPMQGDSGGTQLLVRTQGEYSARLTMTTIRAIFPHVIDHPTMVQRLLSRPLTGCCQYDFIFDCSTNRIVRFDADMNFLPAFVQILPDPAQLAFLLSQAKISEEMFIGELDEFEEAMVRPSTPVCERLSPHEGSPVSPSLPKQPVASVHTVEASPSRALKMADLLSDDVESPRRPSIS